MITKQQRIALRSIGQTLPDLVFIGKDQLTDNVLKQIEDNLYAHELIKIKVQNNCEQDIYEVAQDIVENTNCEVVTVIGSKILVYKQSEKEDTKNLAQIRKIMR